MSAVFSIDPKRELLLKALEAYQPTHQADSLALAKFQDFVRIEPDCFERSLEIGHLTASCWLVNERKDSVLLTHHRKLGIWIQLGGHADGDGNLLGVAIKEAEEESGIQGIKALDEQIFDIDVHLIPERKGEPMHEHFDVRFLLIAPTVDDFEISRESLDLKWVPISEIEKFTHEASVLRMREKWLMRFNPEFS